MIIDIDLNYKDRLNKSLDRLNGFKNGLYGEGVEVLDYLDYFEFNFLSEVQKSLPKRVQKIYSGKQSLLVDKLPQIKAHALETLDTRKISMGIECIDKDANGFMALAFTGRESLDPTPIDLLIDAEYHAIVARTIYMATHEAQEEM